MVIEAKQQEATTQDLEDLRKLYNVRYFVQQYAQGKVDKESRKEVIETYNLLADTEENRRYVLDLIKSQIEKVTFNPYAYKTTTAKEDKAQRKAVKQSKEQNKQVEMFTKQIKDEVLFQQSRGKMQDVPQDAVFTAVKFEGNDSSGNFVVEVKGLSEPLKFPLKKRGSKHFSALGAATVSSKGNPGKDGFTQKSYELLEAAGAAGIKLQTAEQVENVGNKYTPSAYKKFLGLTSKDELSAKQCEELEILNGLSQTDQQSFLLGVKQRAVKAKEYQGFSEELEKYSDPIKLLSQADKLQLLFDKCKVKVNPESLQDNFIENVIMPDKENVWSCFEQNQEGNERFSEYDVLKNRFVTKYAPYFKEALEDSDLEEAKKHLQHLQYEMRKTIVPLLFDRMCTEIVAAGIFREGVLKSPNEQKLQNMNRLLNEFDINIKFVDIPVTRIPDESIENAAQQLKISRDKFEDVKRNFGKTYDLMLQQKLKAAGIEKAENSSIHHYLALKYEAFTDKPLNTSRNFVQTVRENPWNTDGHRLVHEFDTAGEFLVKSSDGQYSLLDFNALRKACKSGANLVIQAPVLQVKQDGKFADLLSLKENGMGFYACADNNEKSYIRVPEFLDTNNGGRGSFGGNDGSGGNGGTGGNGGRGD